MPKLAKCGIHSLSFCNTKHDAQQCDNCILVKHRDKLYKYQNGYKLKRCPHCGEYKMLNEFKINSKGNRSWCYSCAKKYAQLRYQNESQVFIVGYKKGHKKEYTEIKSLTKTFAFAKEIIKNNVNAYVEIKRIK